VWQALRGQSERRIRAGAHVQTRVRRAWLLNTSSASTQVVLVRAPRSRRASRRAPGLEASPPGEQRTGTMKQIISESIYFCTRRNSDSFVAITRGHAVTTVTLELRALSCQLPPGLIPSRQAEAPTKSAFRTSWRPSN
jgi:hypothetical protein